jgi:proton glutamate symport protein
VNWVTMLMPGNLAQAAAEGALLPLLVFSILFGAALTRLSEAQREPVERVLRGVAEAMLVVVKWLLAAAPVGIFALALGLSAKTGTAGAGALGIYVAAFCALLAGLIVALYGVAALFGGIPMGQFTRALLPAQAVAVSTRSSMAALPALLEAAQNRLRLPEAVTAFLLPMAVSLFRFLAPAGQVAGALFVARLYGIELRPEQAFTLISTSVLLSFTAPGIPSSGILVALPLFDQLGLPAEGIGLLVALDLIPDMFKTPGNVTAHMTLAAIVSRRAARGRAGDV